MSAVDGLKVGISGIQEDEVVMISVAFLVILFSAQRYGTSKLGLALGPALFIWFCSLAGVGIYNLVKYDRNVLRAFNPIHIYYFFKRNSSHAWLSLEGCLLCVPEALVNVGADMTNLVPGRVSAEVDARLAFDTHAIIQKVFRLVTSNSYVKCDSGLDLEVGEGDCPRLVNRKLQTGCRLSWVALKNIRTGSVCYHIFEPLIYGFASGNPLRFKRAVGHKDLFYIDDKDVQFKDVTEALQRKAPLDTAAVAHWLAIEGVQPAIPENAPVKDGGRFTALV